MLFSSNIVQVKNLGFNFGHSSISHVCFMLTNGEVNSTLPYHTFPLLSSIYVFPSFPIPHPQVLIIFHISPKWYSLNSSCYHHPTLQWPDLEPEPPMTNGCCWAPSVALDTNFHVKGDDKLMDSLPPAQLPAPLFYIKHRVSTAGLAAGMVFKQWSDFFWWGGSHRGDIDTARLWWHRLGQGGGWNYYQIQIFIRWQWRQFICTSVY
jgi:hypothetical protein